MCIRDRSLAEAAIRIRVFFARNSDLPNGYFNPTKEQAPYLEAVDDSFLLPLPSVVVNALRQNGALNLLPKRGETVSYTHLDVYKRQTRDHAFSEGWLGAMPRVVRHYRSGKGNISVTRGYRSRLRPGIPALPVAGTGSWRD